MVLKAETQPKALLFVRDLIFSRSLLAEAQALGQITQNVRSLDALKASLSPEVSLLLVDLAASRNELPEIASIIKGYSQVALCGFHPHVDKELAQFAESLGYKTLHRSKALAFWREALAK
jgi:hypothetical protein